ncbi:class I SAM-dependent methyltransferase [Umezawaea sp.]|uniref:class I SAM-dependent methyltransferase n=1 Tax=Umezawaea sp. TaxID=1955258 RepID=UPI002ED54E73
MGPSELLESSTVAAFDLSARGHDRFAVDSSPAMGAVLVQRAGLRDGEHVLEVRCGRGSTLLAALDAVGENGSVMGVDHRPGMVQLAGARVRARHWNGSDVRLDDAGKPNFQPGSFDVVLADLMIVQLSDPAAALRHYATLLRPAGRIAFSTVAAPDPAFTRALAAIGRFAPEVGARRGPFHDEASIRGFVTGHGYERVVITEDVREIRFRDPEHWLEWVWANGGRDLLARVPAGHLPRARAAAFAEIEAARSSEGDLVLATEVRFTVAEPRSPAHV